MRIQNNLLQYIAVFMVLLGIGQFSHAQVCEWVKSPTGVDIRAGSAIASDANGNSYVTSYFKETATFGSIEIASAGSFDIFIAKYNETGICLWAKQMGGINNDGGLDISVDPKGNSYVTGFFSGIATFGSIQLTSAGGNDIFIVKYDTNGNCLWAKQIGGIYSDQANGIFVDVNGNSYVTGHFCEIATFGSIKLSSAGYDDIFIAKYDANGNCLWVKQMGGTDYDGASDISVDANGNSYLTGYFEGTAKFGSVQLISSGREDIFVAKCDVNGKCIWAKQISGTVPTFLGGNGISVDTNGNCYITGGFGGIATFDSIQLTSAGDGDIFLAKYDTNGNCLWAKQMGGTGYDVGSGISLDPDGNSYVTGSFFGRATFDSIQLASAGTEDIFTAKFDINGNCLSAKQMGSSENDYGYSISVDKNANSYVSGYFEGTAAFGTIKLTGGGFFVAKLVPSNSLPVEVRNTVPVQNSLEQNYPNPFNPSTSISYNLSVNSNVTLKVYDILGKEVTTLVNGIQNAGNHRVNFNTQYFALPSGIYIYKLHAGSFSTTKKMLLLK